MGRGSRRPAACLAMETQIKAAKGSKSTRNGSEKQLKHTIRKGSARAGHACVSLRKTPQPAALRNPLCRVLWHGSVLTEGGRGQIGDGEVDLPEAVQMLPGASWPGELRPRVLRNLVRRDILGEARADADRLRRPGGSRSDSSCVVEIAWARSVMIVNGISGCTSAVLVGCMAGALLRTGQKRRAHIHRNQPAWRGAAATGHKETCCDEDTAGARTPMQQPALAQPPPLTASESWRAVRVRRGGSGGAWVQ